MLDKPEENQLLFLPIIVFKAFVNPLVTTHNHIILYYTSLLESDTVFETMRVLQAGKLSTLQYSNKK